MRKRVFGEVVTAVDVERLPPDTGPTDFVRLCGALIARALAERVGVYTLPRLSDRIAVPDEGVDAEYATPEDLPVHETGGLIGPGRTVFQFKYRDVGRSNRAEIVRRMTHKLREEFPEVAPRCDRYVFMTNVDLSGVQSRRLVEAMSKSSPASVGKRIVVWGAAEIANALNSSPHLRHLYFAREGLCTLGIAEDELQTAYAELGWLSFVDRQRERDAIARFVTDKGSRVLQVVGLSLVGKTRLIIEGLRQYGSLVLWASDPKYATLDLFRDLDSEDSQTVLVIDRCTEAPVGHVIEWARERRWLKTIVIASGPGLGETPSDTSVLVLKPLEDEQAWRLAEHTLPHAAFAELSWLSQASGGLPGLLLHLAVLLKSEHVSSSMNPELVRERLGEFLEEKYLPPLNGEERQALSALSLLPGLGFEGRVGKEVDAVCRALGVPPESLGARFDKLERRGLTRRRGRFIEVAPPLLAEHLASQALRQAQRIVAELELTLSPGAFLSFLERFRNLPAESVRSTIVDLLSQSGWFRDLEAFLKNINRLEILAPAAPVPAMACIERALGKLTVEELALRVTREARRSLVWALEDLVLRSETFVRAARQLLALAEAENEPWANRATGVFWSLFYWQHPEISASLSLRLGVLDEGAGSDLPVRRRIVAEACRQAFEPHALTALHEPKGPGIPERPYRPATWEEVGRYAAGVLDLLEQLFTDVDPEVRRAATEACVGSFYSVAEISMRLSPTSAELHKLGRRAFELVRTIGGSTESARLRADIVSTLEWMLERLRKGDSETALPAVRAVIRATENLLNELTQGSLRARLWRWIGPKSHSAYLGEGRGADRAAAIEKIVIELLESLELLDEHLGWLMTDEAVSAGDFFHLLGKRDRGRQVLNLLLARSEEPLWADRFSAYVTGWAAIDLTTAVALLDRLLDERPEFLEGVLRATCMLEPSAGSVERVLKVLHKAGARRRQVVGQVAWLMRWNRLSATGAERLIGACDDGTPEVRFSLLPAFTMRQMRGAEVTPELRDLAWEFLRSSFGLGKRGTTYYEWDSLAADLGKQDPLQLRRLIEDLIKRLMATGDARVHLKHQFPLVWQTLSERDHCGFLEMLLRISLNEKKPSWIEFSLGEMVDPTRDMEILLEFARLKGAEGARIVARSLDAEKPGFWEIATLLLTDWGDDEFVRRLLWGRLVSGGWSGSAIPMIARRFEGAKKLVSDVHVRVATWAQEAISLLEDWQARAKREDEEDWIWDYRIGRSDFEAMVQQKDSPERLWAISRLLKDAPKERVLELLTPDEILDTLPKIQNLDERTRQMWEAWARHWSESH
ncbi:MAG: hypothetical protein ACE5JD_04370 [Candidatus Methylomirabilia bacterium]